MRLMLLYIPTPTQSAARQLARALLKKKIIACANVIGPAVSLYHWKAKLERAREYILIVKTVPELREAVERAVERLHPYEIPCIISCQVKVNKKYFEWVRGETVRNK